MKRTFSSVLLLAAALFSAFGQENILDLRVETRFDYSYFGVEGEMDPSRSGFDGTYLNLVLLGNLTDNLSYGYRQRLNRQHSDASFFDATDWLFLTYRAGNFELSGGKEVVAIGGFEYDRPPIDTYIYSEFCNHIPCFQLGINAGFYFNGDKDKVLYQLCQSPFGGRAENTYGHSIEWYGNHGFYNSIWSVNFFEYTPGKYVNYAVLGNMFNVGPFSLILDFQHRAFSTDDFMKDWTLFTELSYKAGDSFKGFVKYDHDYNMSSQPLGNDWCLAPGTNLSVFAAGIEYFPLKNDKVRLHAVASYSNGDNTTPAGFWADGSLWFNFGVKWKMNLLKLKK